jgi:serine/threonine-protein kinase
MAPEQAASGDVDARTDIYSVGVMLWQAAAGARRWKGVQNQEVLRRLHSGEVNESPNATQHGLPRLVDTIVLKATASDPDDRYSSAAQFREALEDLLKEMRASVSTRDLADLMAAEFADARRRAGKIIDERITELDATLQPPESNEREIAPKPSTTGLREVAREKAPMRESEPAKKQTTDDSGDRAASAPSVAKARRKSDPVRSTPEVTQRSEPARRSSRVVPIALIGLVATAALAFLALRTAGKRSPPESLAPAPTSAATAPEAITTPPDAVPEARSAAQSPSSVAESPSAIASSAAAVGVSKSASSAAPNVRPARTASSMPAAATGAAAPPAASAVVVPSASASTDHPALDKQDPWHGQGNGRVDHADPWSSGSRAPAPRPDPWAK